MFKDIGLLDNKIIILYILDQAAKPLTIEQIAKFCDEFEDITYFDIFDYLEKLKESNYITQIINNDTTLYKLSSEGLTTLTELLELIPGVNLRSMKKLVDKNIVEFKTDYTIKTQIVPIKSDEYNVICYIKDGNDELISITIYAGNKEQAKLISKNWQENAEEIYAKTLELMTNGSSISKKD